VQLEQPQLHRLLPDLILDGYLITAVALAITLLATPALTQSVLAASPNDVIVNGKNIGSDPDAGVRYQMRRDVGSEGF
jgi:hypothetical protein